MFETPQAVGQADFEVTLQQRVECGEYSQAPSRQFVAGITRSQLALDQVEIGGKRIDARQAVDDTERCRRGRGIGLRVQQALFEHDLEYQVAAQRGLFGRPERIVARGSLDHTDQQRQVLRLEVFDTASKQHATGARKAVNRDSILLQQEHFVDVSGDDCALAEAQFEQQRHESLVDLSQQRFFRGQEHVLRQLLGQRAAALHRPARLQVRQQGTHNGFRAEPVVLIKLAVLDRD